MRIYFSLNESKHSKNNYTFKLIVRNKLNSKDKNHIKYILQVHSIDPLNRNNVGMIKGQKKKNKKGVRADNRRREEEGLQKIQ